MRRRIMLPRALLALVVMAGVAFAAVPGPVVAATASCDAPPCVEVYTHSASGISAPQFVDAAALRAIGDQQGQLTGATFASLGAQVQTTTYQRVAVVDPGTSAPSALEAAQADGPAQGSRPIVFVDANSVLGYSRPASPGTAAEVIRASTGQNLRVDLYVTGYPLRVSIDGPDEIRQNKAATFTASARPATQSANVGSLTYTWTYSDGKNPRPNSTSPTSTHTFTTRDKNQSVAVTVTGQDGSFGTSSLPEFAVGRPETPKPPTNGNGGGGNGNGSGSDSPSTGTPDRSGSSPGATSTGPVGPTGAPIDPFRVPPSADRFVPTDPPGIDDFANGAEQVSGLVLTGTDGAGQLSDLDPSQSGGQTSAQTDDLTGQASPLGIALLAAGVLLVLVASAAAELTGLQPTTRPRRTRRDR